MSKIQVFDKPMCCSSGVCGPNVDPALVAFAADLQWLTRQGVQVQRINPLHEPALFAASELVREELQKNSSTCLPLVVVNGAVVSRGVFPTRTELAKWAGVLPSSSNELPVIESSCCSNPKSTSNSSSCC
jgi:hypothetical protein